MRMEENQDATGDVGRKKVRQSTSRYPMSNYGVAWDGMEKNWKTGERSLARQGLATAMSKGYLVVGGYVSVPSSTVTLGECHREEPRVSLLVCKVADAEQRNRNIRSALKHQPSASTATCIHSPSCQKAREPTQLSRAHLTGQSAVYFPRSPQGRSNPWPGAHAASTCVSRNVPARQKAPYHMDDGTGEESPTDHAGVILEQSMLVRCSNLGRRQPDSLEGDEPPRGFSSRCCCLLLAAAAAAAVAVAVAVAVVDTAAQASAG
ncbi:hypothetical protein CPLU01_03344 [Colletotrichum plurivorum]|uniref:Uncharacterized protein n=1 Tax=Colletotrichum plurivorum TaxID=2175906 RepID=A0A8H6KSY9_9PEZI|nr:hypothetical protein CPLU01_03344 [Colletotrichum plurivorum]